MAEINLFEKAARKKYRFPFKGNSTIEDLWDLSLAELDSIFKILNSQNKAQKEESLLDTKDSKNVDLENQIGIIKYIVGIKQAEAAAAKSREDKKQEKQKLLSILANKKEEELMGKSAEEIQALINGLSEDEA